MSILCIAPSIPQRGGCYLLHSYNWEPGRCPCTSGTGAGEQPKRGFCPDLRLSWPVPAKQTAVALLPPAAHTDASAGTSCAFGVHTFFGSFSRGTAGRAIWQFPSGYLASDALTVLAKSCSTGKVPGACWSPCHRCSNTVFLLPKISRPTPLGKASSSEGAKLD